MVVSSIAEDDPARAIGYLEQIDNARERSEASRRLLNTWIRKDPEAAINWVLGQDDRNQRDLVGQIGQSLVDHDVDAAMRILPKLQGSGRDALRQQIAFELAVNRSPAEAQYFEAYSDASEKKVRNLLEELENFRAAVEQVLVLEIPPGAAKTQVIILRSNRDFRAITDDKGTAAFVIGLRGIPYIVMPVGLGRGWSQTAIRHEYTHVLMAYSEHRFPKWYEEGFAEFMSGTQFTNKGTTFTLGDSTGRQRVGERIIPWRTLTADSFEFHSYGNVVAVTNAYYQSWLLVHYLMIGEQFKYLKDVGMFLGHFSEGKSSAEAFEIVFGMSADELGSLAMKQYRRRTPFYQIDFKPGIQDHNFSRSETDAEEIKNTIVEIHELFVSYRGK